MAERDIGQSRDHKHRTTSTVAERAADSLSDKLIRLPVSSLDVSPYTQRYFGDLIANLDSMLGLYGRLLSLAHDRYSADLSDSVVIDYGGGCGLMSFLALEMGVGTVIYNDIYEVSCHDVLQVSDTLGLRPHHVVCGDVDDLVSYLAEGSISANAIVSYDVIEHIYDVRSHFHALTRLSLTPIRLVYASSANPENPTRARSLRTLQTAVEHRPREAKWGHKERDALRPYLDIRREIISKYAPDLPEAETRQLADATRGLVKPDIEACIDEFRSSGEISYRPNHPTNTCDPYTGNWCEHLIDLRELRSFMSKEGYSVSVLPGLYHQPGTSIKGYIKRMLNVLIRLSRRRGTLFAPYYVLCADYPA